MYERNVLIAGAGLTGLTLALELARRGLPFRLVEEASQPFSGSRGKGIQPRTLEIFDDLGVIGEILQAGCLYPRFRVHLGPLSFRAGSLGTRKQPEPETPYPNLWMVPQARTEQILRDRLKELCGCVESGTALTSFVQDGEEVRAILSTGEQVRCDFLVGCDGGHSQVRKILGLDLNGESFGKTLSLVADVEIPTLDRTDWHIWPFSKGGMIGLCPLPGKLSFQCTMPAAVAANGLEASIYRATGHSVTNVNWSSTYRPSARMVDRYRVGRVLLAGDAAHVHPPEGAQGLNTGIQDAYNLGWKLAYVMTGGAEMFLDSYQEERLPVAAAALGLSTQLHQTRSRKRGSTTNQLALNYRTSSLSSGEPFGDLKPGDRMPDEHLGDGSTVYDHLRGCHATEIECDEGMRILVRPDGYIASIGPEAHGAYAGQTTSKLRWSPRHKW